MRKLLLYSICLLGFFSCKKFTEVGSASNQLSSQTVFNSDATATSALLMIYAQMEADGLFYELPVATGLSADELINYAVATDRVDLFTNNLRPDNASVSALWTRFYDMIYKSNAVIEGLNRSTAVSAAVQRRLSGEAFFLRAFCHFYLLQLFGDIPISTSTDYQINARSARAASTEVYQQIESDLLVAIDQLGDSYVNAKNVVTAEKTRPNRAAAQMLLSKVYLYQGKWAAADLMATAVMESPQGYALCSDINQVFLKNSSEAIWQLQATIPGFNSYAGGLFPFEGLPYTVSLQPDLFEHFQAGDWRGANWIKRVIVNGEEYAYPYKYKVGQGESTVTEYTMVFRLAELLLIRAEARGRLGRWEEASDDINKIRTRAQLTAISISNLSELLAELEKQRRWELFAESADRWMDLKRLGRLDSILSVFKAPQWSVTDQLYPIPQSEINRNPRLVQNPGY